MGSVKQALHFFDQGKRLANNSGFVFLDQLFAANLRLLWIQTGFERELIQPIYSDMRFFASLDLCTLLLINTTSCILQAKNDSAFRWIAKAESCVEYLIERKDNCSWARQSMSHLWI
jgi:hypothetical protein